MSASTLDAFRARFPIFRERIYVNSCSQGALSVDVEAALSRFTASWHDHGSPWEQWVGEVERLRTLAAGVIGADPGEVAVMPNASVAISAIATSLAFDTARRGVVLGAFEFPTHAHVWLAQQRRGASIVWAPAAGDTLPIDHYAARVNDQTLIVPAAHVCYRNGYRLDAGALVRLCRERGAYSMLDDYQHTGTGPLDVHALGIDFLVTGTLKYLLGPSGVAFLYVRRALLDRLEPLQTGWFGRVEPFAFDPTRLDWSPTARRFETGTPAVPNAYAAAAALELLVSLGQETVIGQIEMLVERMASGARVLGFDLMSPDELRRRSALVVLRSLDAATLVRRLAARGIVSSARGEGLRISFHAYNSTGDVDAVLEALKAEAPLLHRRDYAD